MLFLVVLVYFEVEQVSELLMILQVSQSIKVGIIVPLLKLSLLF